MAAFAFEMLKELGKDVLEEIKNDKELKNEIKKNLPQTSKILEKPLMDYLKQFKEVTWENAQQKFKELYKEEKGNDIGWSASYNSTFLSLKNKGKISLMPCDDEHPGFYVCKTCKIVVKNRID